VTDVVVIAVTGPVMCGRAGCSTVEPVPSGVVAVDTVVVSGAAAAVGANSGGSALDTEELMSAAVVGTALDTADSAPVGTPVAPFALSADSAGTLIELGSTLLTALLRLTSSSALLRTGN
jgi:hypothetical protein